MRILVVGFYDDFARFFLNLKKELKRNNKDICFDYYSIYFSGVLYFISRFHKVTFISFIAKVKAVLNCKKYRNLLKKDSEKYKNISLTEVIEYHRKLNNSSIQHLKFQAMAYIDIIDQEFLLNRPELVILSGDSRMVIEIMNLKCKEYKIETYYFEQGPFNTSIIDKEGVNANASIRDKWPSSNSSAIEKEKAVYAFFDRKPGRKYKRNPVYRGSDYLLQVLLKILGFLPPDIEMEKKKYIKSPVYKSLDFQVNFKTTYLLILQVPYDVNMVFHSPFYNDHTSIVKDIYKNLPNNSSIVVREHPLYRGMYGDELYKFLLDKQIVVDCGRLDESLSSAEVVIVNNSTVGIEAIAKYIPLVVLGDSYYDSSKLCLKLLEKDDLGNLLEKALSYKPDRLDVLNFLDYLLNKYLIDGHFRNNQLVSTEQIVRMVMKKRGKYVQG